MKPRRLILAIICIIICNDNVLSQSFLNCKNIKSWEIISPYFEPLSEYKNNYGDYRSPLLFYNGDTVKTKAEWEKRCTEIKRKWLSMIGEFRLI